MLAGNQPSPVAKIIIELQNAGIGILEYFMETGSAVPSVAE